MYRLDLNASPPIQPILDNVISATTQIVFEIVTAVFVVFSICYFIREVKKTKSYYPIMFFLGAGVAFFAEPLFDIGQGHIYFHVGQHEVYELLNRKIPFFILLCYFGYLPAFFAIAGNLMEKGINRKTILLSYAAMAIGCMAVEIPVIYFGLWHYPGEHKLRILGYPPMIGIVNGIAYLVTSVAYMKLKPILTGNKQVMAILIIPIVFAMGEFGVGWPLYSVISSTQAIESNLFVFTGILTTLVFAAAIIWWVCETVAVDKRLTD